ncbi:hypothetical protein SDC9_208230 [bioreactor metagenome]|uniref:Uncharacterized protein n=1 Tax=bioreactor metagenome TaxID=1076179 RepID=A0A645JBH4_9ZZZZ
MPGADAAAAARRGVVARSAAGLDDEVGDQAAQLLELRVGNVEHVADLAVALNLPFFHAGQRTFFEQNSVRNPDFAKVMILRQQPNAVDPFR